MDSDVYHRIDYTWIMYQHCHCSSRYLQQNWQFLKFAITLLPFDSQLLGLTLIRFHYGLYVIFIVTHFTFFIFEAWHQTQISMVNWADEQRKAILRKGLSKANLVYLWFLLSSGPLYLTSAVTFIWLSLGPSKSFGCYLILGS